MRLLLIAAELSQIMRIRTALAVTASAVSLTLAGCGLTETLRPYKLDIRQGNYVTQEMVSNLKKGMSRDQVRFALGTPLLTDVFHADRWDYLYRFDPGYGEVEQRRISLFFDGDQLARVEGDVTAASGEPAAAPQRRIRELDLSAPASAAGEEKSE